MALREMPKVGEKVRYIGGICCQYDVDVTEGKTYAVVGFDVDGDAYFTDDEGERMHIVSKTLENYELVSEAPQPDVTGLIANLGRRVHELEGADAVNPDHYKRGKYETIEVIEHITAGYDDGFVAHCAGTAIKYIARAPFKHATPTEDLRKAAKYLEFAIKRLEAGESE